MRSHSPDRTIDRRGFLGSLTLAGAAVVAPGIGNAREADYILKRMRVILKEFGADLTNAVRVDQFYTQGPAVSAYHLSRFAEFGGYIPPSTSIIMERCFTARTNTHATLLAAVPGPNWEIEKFTLPGQPISASGYNPAVAVNDFVFVAGNMALLDTGELPPAVRILSLIHI